LAGARAGSAAVSGILLREATRQDLPAVCRLWVHLDNFHHELGLPFPAVEDGGTAWAASFERTLGRFSFLWVAEQEGEVCAFLLARLKRLPATLGGMLVGEISDLYVEEGLRGQKVGARLAGLAIERLRRENAHSIEVQVIWQNEEALAFWQAQGFQPELAQLRLMGSS
jgi:GNAT superfamily N-acetyltransferase